MGWLNASVLTGASRRRFPPPPHCLAPGGRQRAALTHPYFPAFSNGADRRRAWWGIPPEARFIQQRRRLEGYIMMDYAKLGGWLLG